MSRMSAGSSSSKSGGGGVTTALPFIQTDASGRFFLQPKAIQLIQSIKGKICPVVVAGPYRTGKSTLLNLLLDRNVKSGAGGGFQVGGTVQACTKGLWIWGEPIVMDDCTYIFIDSEGLGSVDQHATFDTQIFSLSILLSSLFILNTQGTINETALEQLELVVQMTDRIRIREDKKVVGAQPPGGLSTASSQHESLGALAQFFPSFMWILRDFTLELQNSRGERITSDEYLEDSLRPVQISEKSKKGAAEKNRIRTAIATVFPQRHCVTMVRPVMEEKDLQRVSSIGQNSLRNEFRTQIDEIKQMIPRLAQPKSVENVTLNGRAFIQLAEQYINAINTGTIPTIRTAFQSVQEIQSREAMDQALEFVQAAIRDQIDAKGDKHVVSEEALNKLLDDIQQQACAIILDQAIGSPADLQQLQQHFITKHLNTMFQSLRERNVHRAEKHFSSVVEQLWDESGIESKLPKYDTYQALNDDVTRFWTKYLQQTKGQASKSLQIDIGRTFLDKKREIIFKMLFEKLSNSNQQLTAATKANTQLTNEVQSLKQERQDRALEVKKLELELTSHQKESTKLQKEVADLERRLRTTEEKAQTDRATWERQSHESTRASTTQLTALQTQLNTTQASLAQMEAEVKSLTKEKSRLEKALTAASNEAASASGASKQAQQLQTELRSIQSELSKTESQVDGLQTKLTSSQAALKQAESERAQVAKELAEAVKSKEKQTKIAEKNGQDCLELTKQLMQRSAEIQALQQQLAKAEARATAATNAVAAANLSAYNPLGLPAPTAGPLVSRKSVIPTSFSRPSDTPSKATGKRKSSPAVVEEDEENVPSSHDFEMVDAEMESKEEEEDEDSDSEHAARRESSAPSSAAASKSTLRGDPNTLPINQLKSWLTSLDVEFPQKAQPKAFYVDLIYQTLGEKVEKEYPRGGPKKKGKK